MSQIVQIASNAVTAKLFNASREMRLEIMNTLSYAVAGAEYSGAFKHTGWDGRSTFYNFGSDTFPAGFVHLVRKKLERLGAKVQLVRKPLPAPRGPVVSKIDAFGFDPRYDYQPETVDKLLRHGQIIAQIATGGGKSRIARLCYDRIRRTTLFLTTRGVLMHQMKDAFEEDSGMSVGVLGDSEWSPKNGMNVGMVQTFMARLKHFDKTAELDRLRKKNTLGQKRAKETGVEFIVMNIADMRKLTNQKEKAHDKRREQTIALLNKFEFVILEEAHEVGGDSYFDIMKHCKVANYRLSLTATPFMRDSEADNMRLMACSGPVAIKVSEKLLIDRGILAKPFFKYLEVVKPDRIYRSTPWQRAYKFGIVQAEYRNKQIAAEVIRAAKMGLTSMILIQHKAHGEKLQKLISKYVRVEFIYGKHEQRDRKAAIARLANGEIDVLIGTTILDVGVDVPAVGVIILAGGGKAEVALRQRIGRGLRCKKVGPNVAMIVDFSDETNTYLRDHAKQRRAIVENTPGFGENIVPKGQDFDFAAMGFKVAA
tara:strand:+ start:53084 stop:54700 length:1617 start_codon:yes stop_codon:yes gene_type:complete